MLSAEFILNNESENEAVNPKLNEEERQL